MHRETIYNKDISRPFNILYGNNGSGKTTISRHFIEHNQDLYEGTAHVFNDKFIAENVALRQNGVQVIAMLGSQEIADEEERVRLATANKQINSLTRLKNEAREQLQRLSETGGQDKTQAMDFINDCLSMVFFDKMNR